MIGEDPNTYSTHSTYALLSFSAQIRKKQVPDLREPPRRAATRKHNICHSANCLLSCMLWFTSDP
ncbi:hypothetical protein R991_004294 [Salmonella enterica]|nr:hypothetical protein [Salmonella enterica]